MSDDTEEVDAELLIDRLVSASTSEDVVDAVQRLVTVPFDPYLAHHPDALNALLQVYSGSYKNLTIQDVGCVPQLYLKLLQNNTSHATEMLNTLLNEPEEGRLLEICIDVCSDASSHSAYTRVLSLQLIGRLCKSKYCQQQLLRAPNGLHRLGDLLKSSDEMIRNELLQLAQILSKFSSVAKIWMFSEVSDVLLDICNAEGGLSGSLLVVDSLQILQNMLGHDAALADLVFQSPSFIPQLSKLLDLRAAHEFRNPPPVPVSDDLDDMLAQSKQQPAAVVPKLKEREETIISHVFEILSVVLENDGVQQSIFKSHEGLVTLVWELGLIAPPSQPPFPCAFPSIDLQCQALLVMAKYLNRIDILHKHAGMDRLLYLVCTGGPSATLGLEDKMQLSLSSLFVLRQSLTDTLSNEMLMQGLAPPMDGNVQPPVARKLLNTALENLPVDAKEVSNTRDTLPRKVFLAGSLSALGLFLTDEPRRSILYRITTSVDGDSNGTESKLLYGILTTLETESDEFIVLYLLRFLGQWILEAPMIVQEVLKNANTTLIELFKKDKQPAVSGMAGLVIGLLMEYMGDDESLCGGWTRSSLLKVVSPISKLTGLLEGIKTNQGLPWRYCKSEMDVWTKWYESVVLVVRKRLVSQLTDTGDSTTETVNSGELHSMQKLVAEQSKELEELRNKSVTSERTIQAQAKELSSWKLRVESTSTQLDEMLNEYTAKNSELEQTILKLQDEINASKQSHAAELSDRQMKYDELQQQLSTAQNTAEAAQDDRDSLREDMEALSQAYSNLEDEFRRQQTQSASTPTAEAHQEERSHQQQGEESSQQQSGSTEVATLRAENTRMREDAKAADEWMSMAVERMDTMAAEATSYQEQISSLQAQVASTGDETAVLLSRETETRLRLESELSSATKAMETERNQRVELEQYIETSRVEFERVSRSLQESNIERHSLQEELSVLRSQDAAAVEGQVEHDVANMASLETTIASLRAEVDAVKNELTTNLQRERYEIDTRDARIRELEAGASGQDDNELAIENQQLREANDSAQDWMNKAVEHHQALSGEVSTLKQTNADLVAEMDILKQNAATSSGTERMHGEAAQSRDGEIQDLLEEIAQLQQVVQSHESQSSAISDVQERIGIKEAELNDLRALSVVKDQEIELLRSQVATSALAESTESLHSELVDKENQLVSLNAEVDELRNRENELLQRIADLEATHIEVGTTKEELEELRARAAEAETRQQSIEKILDVVAKEKEELAAEAEKNRDALEKIESELTELRGVDLDTSQTSEWRESMKEAVTNLETQLEQQRTEATSVIAQWQESYEALQAQHNETIEKLNEALSEKQALDEELSRTQSDIGRLQSELATAIASSASVPVLSDEIASMKVQIGNLQEQLADQEADANDSIEQWQDSFNEVQASLDRALEDNKDLSSRLEAALAKAEVSETSPVRDLEESVRVLEEKLAVSNGLVTQTSSALIEKEATIQELEGQLTDLRKLQDGSLKTGGELSSDEARVAESQHQLGEAADDLETVVANLKEQLADQAEDARLTIAEWENCYNELEQQFIAVQKQSATTGTESQETTDPIANAALQEQLSQQETEAANVIAQWQESYQDVQKQLEVLEQEKAALLSQLDDTKGRTVEPHGDSERDSLKESTNVDDQVKDLQEQLTQHEAEASAIISQWQESHEDVSTQLEALSKEKERLIAELQESRDHGLATQVSQKDAGVSHDADDQVTALQALLSQQEEEASAIVAQWQESYDDLSMQIEGMRQENAVLQKKIDSFESPKGTGDGTELLASLDSGEPSVTDQIDASELKNLRDQLVESNQIAFQWQQSYEEIAEQLKAADDAKALLEGQLQQAQPLMTDLGETQVTGDDETMEPGAQRDTPIEPISVWQEKYEQVAAELSVVSKEKEALLDRLDAARAQASDLPEGESSSAAEENTKDQLRGLQEELSRQQGEAEAVVSQWQQSYNDAEVQLQALTEENDRLREEILEAQRIATDLQSSSPVDQTQTAQSEEQLRTLQEQLSSAEGAVSLWRERYEELEAELLVLKKAHETRGSSMALDSSQRSSAEEQVEDLQSRLAEQEDDSAQLLVQWEESYNDIRAQLDAVESEQVKPLQDRLSLQEKESSETISRLKSDLNDLTSQLASAKQENESLLVQLENVRVEKSDEGNVENAVASLQKKLSDMEADAVQTIQDWEERCKETESELASQQRQAEEVVAQWDTTYRKLQDEYDELRTELEQVQLEFQINSEELKKARACATSGTDEIDNDGVIEDLEQKLQLARSATQAQEAEVRKLEDLIANKDDVIQQLRRTVDSTSSASSSVHVEAANKRIEELMDEKYDLQCALNETKTENQKLTNQRDQVEENLRGELDQVRSASEFDLQTLNAELAIDREKLHQLETRIDEYRAQNASLEHKKQILEGRVGELEDELREVDANLQLHLTNMVMAKGSDEAKEILMRQLEDTREKHHEDKGALMVERDSREAAEAEVERLKADLAAMLGMDDCDSNPEIMQRKLAEAKENFQRAERTEIESLKHALARALDELEDARSAEKVLQDKAAKANHQAVLYEQEIINTKSDFKFLSQTVDEIRESESSKRASLEYRISALENENSVQQRFHAAELENLRNELTQVNMERDRIFQAVKESEKSKEVLLQVKKSNVPVGDESDPYAELARLRIEKAQLLTAASEEAARIERRLRETRAAAKASSEADVILEKELRLSAEKSLESVMLEVHQLRAENQTLSLSVAKETAPSDETIQSLKKQLADSREEIDRLTSEYRTLSDETEMQKRENALRIDRLTEECQQAKARLSHLERDGRYEAEVRAEMARLRTSTTSDGVLVTLDPEEEADENDESHNVAVAKLYDVIDKQKKAINEERVVYFNLVKEHDDLLALLAQENLIKESLSGALSRASGSDAVAAAIEEAENKAKEQYRKYVRLS